MYVFSDIFSKEELFDDNYEVTDYNDVLYKVKAVKKSSNVDLDPSLFGANKGDAGISGERGENDDDVDGGHCGGGGDNAMLDFNIVLDQGLKEFGFDKSQFKSTLSTYLKKIVSHLESKSDTERASKLKAGAMDFLKNELLPKFDDFSFYTNSEYDTECMVPFAIVSDDGNSAEFFFWKDGLSKTKY